MDDSRGAVDRADPLRSLSRAIARGASQVLQQHLQGIVQPAPGNAKESRVRQGRDLGDPLDLTARCVHCGMPLRHGSRRREFCDDACSRAGTAARRRDEAIEARLCRRCLFCNGPMSREYAGRLYCSRACCWRSSHDQSRMMRKKACARCGTSFRAYSETTKFCSPSCKVEAQRKHPATTCTNCGEQFYRKKPPQFLCSKACYSAFKRELPDLNCEWCGVTFRPRRSSIRCCCLSCSAKAWRNPAALTAARLDRMMGVA